MSIGMRAVRRMVKFYIRYIITILLAVLTVIIWFYWPITETFNQYGYLKSSNILKLGEDHWRSCAPLFPRIVLYNRVFKTGSTSMISFLRENSKKLQYNLLTDFTEQWSNLSTFTPIYKNIQRESLQAMETNSRMIAVSHFYFRKHLSLSTDYTYMNLVRDPIKRFVSYYHYARSPVRWPIRLKELKARGHFNVTLEECLEHQYEGCVWNQMTRFFCGPYPMCGSNSRESLERAKYNIQTYYISVGILEHVFEFVEVLKQRLPSFIGNETKEFPKTFITTGITITPIKDNVRNKIINANHLDIELYEFIKQLFQKQAKLCGVEMNR